MPRSAVALARLLPAPDPAPPDAPLLRAFVSGGAAAGEAAFEELVRRHGPMVLATCRRVLGDPHDAEDAFQAVFLILARKAGAVRGNLAGWLYAVAVRTARGVRLMRDRRRSQRSQETGNRGQGSNSSLSPVPCPLSPELSPDSCLLVTEQAAIIDEELARLPEHYREAVVLCELRGLSRKQAAAELGVPEGTLSSRLAGAKRRLAARLSARGLSAPAALAAALAPASVSAGLLRSAVSATRGAAGPVASAAAGAVMKAMLFDQLKAVALAAGILLTAVCGGWAMTGVPGGSDPATAPSPRLTIDPAAKLVEQLGAPDFADREAAAKKLRELGLKAEPALRAALKSEDPEVRARAAKVLNEIRKDQLWAAFAKVAGDDKATRDLFAHITASARAVDALKAALDDPTRADELYRNRTAELLRIAAGHPPVDAAGKASVPTAPDVWAAPPPPLGDIAGWLFLGALQPGTAPWREVTHEGWQNRLSSHVPFLPEDDYTSAKPVAAAYEGELSGPLKKLTAAWLAKRRENDMLRAGLTLAIRYDIADAVAAARIVLKEPKPTDVSPWNLAAVAILVGLHGTKDDLPLLARHAADDRSYSTILNLPPGTDLTFGAPPVKDGRDLFCHVRDAVAVAMCKLAGKNPADFGFPPFPATKHPDGKPMSLSSATKVGFKAKADRAAAFEKAAAWLKSFEAKKEQPKEESKPDPVSMKLVEQLGAAEFADREAAAKKLRELGMKAEPALRAGLRSESPEVRDRCTKLLGEIRADARDALAKNFKPDGTDDYDHPLWKRYKTIAGDSKASRELFARIIANKKWLRTLDNAEADPANAGHVYRMGIAEMFRDFHNDPAKSPPWPCDRPEEVAYLLLLGSYPDNNPPAKLTGDEIVPPNLRGVQFLGRGIIFGEGQITHANGLSLGLDGKIRFFNAPEIVGAAGTDRVFAKLFAAWLVQRAPSSEVVLPAFRIAFGQRVPEILPLARRFAANDFEPKREVPRNATIAALELIAQSGTRADLPLFERHFGDETNVAAVDPPRDDGALDYHRPAPLAETTQLRDVALGLALLLHGANPEDFGFVVRKDTFKPIDGRYTIPWSTQLHLGFDSDASRTAAFTKAKAWLAEPKEDGPAPGLLRDLADLDGMRRGEQTDFAAVEKKGGELLAKYPAAADRGQIYFALTRVYSNSGITRTWARVTKYGRLALEHEKDSVRRGEVFSVLASAAEVAVKAGDPLADDPFAVKRKRAAEIILEGYRELLPLKLPAVAPDLPGVDKIGDALGHADPVEKARLLARHAAQMKARREAEFVRDMVQRRDTYTAQLNYLYGREPKADAELRELIGELKDPKAAADLLERVAKPR
jgi:RNA polymerase sigma factor (sigma-70 family)